MTAGQLFAESGFDGVSTRTIAEKAQVTLGSIHYHFGSKENLYIEACRRAMSAKKSNGFAEALEENPALIESPEGQAELIRTVVFRTFHDYFRPEREQWERKILVREVANPSSAMPRISEQLFMPDILATRDVFKKIKPSASDEEADIWMDFLHAQIFFYSAAEDTFCLVQGKAYMDQELYQQAARATAKAMILLVQLPLPRDLREH